MLKIGRDQTLGICYTYVDQTSSLQIILIQPPNQNLTYIWKQNLGERTNSRDKR